MDEERKGSLGYLGNRASGDRVRPELRGLKHMATNHNVGRFESFFAHNQKRTFSSKGRKIMIGIADLAIHLK